ncbi:chromate resistance protein ChrB domain-containing protein [Gloeocapsa sp. PCC 73106]|uniref:chromate resistance protein ChrB domain-containing protein n=1 Tax=Gloeocapsa sp. PCC 73106 TaxID=102232 RepID=UPI0002AD017B|nr:chromate resistance protein ChrB domain-containing protein [Gloeocapsa sp. PCC 73106]ELR99559.1 hypothetical protein GLO73106DRAFT_00034110 [Gloeocapsa sp. PCC 73106]
MSWLVFSYSLPSKSQSSPRVTLWRRLRRIGAISLKTGVYILPARDECIEAFQWLANAVQQAKGETLIIHVQQFEGLTDPEIIQLFREVRQQDYAEILQQAEAIRDDYDNARETLAKLRKRYNEIVSIDFFNCLESTTVAATLKQIEQTLLSNNSQQLITVVLAQYQNKQWVTRPRPFIDRLACAWLIRRFINPSAVIRYSLEPQPEEITFDMKDAEFGHQGNLCSFETMIHKFELTLPGLQAIAEIVHVLDLQDRPHIYPETEGIATIIRGWLLLGLSDSELEARALTVFDGLYAMLSRPI